VHSERARREPLDLKPERAQRPLQQRVVLEPIPAAPAAHQLAGQGGRIEPGAAPEQRVDILERNRRRVGRYHGAEGCQIRPARPGVANAIEIGDKIIVAKRHF
jgi:hypothetical protein